MANIDAYGGDANAFLSAGKASGPGPWNEATGNTVGMTGGSHSGWNAFGNNYVPGFANDIVGAHNERKLDDPTSLYTLATLGLYPLAGYMNQRGWHGLRGTEPYKGFNQGHQKRGPKPQVKPWDKLNTLGKIGRTISTGFNYYLPGQFLYDTAKQGFKGATFR